MKFQHMVIIFFTLNDSYLTPLVKKRDEFFIKQSSLRLNTQVWQQVVMLLLALFLLHF